MSMDGAVQLVQKLESGCLETHVSGFLGRYQESLDSGGPWSREENRTYHLGLLTLDWQWTRVEFQFEAERGSCHKKTKWSGVVMVTESIVGAAVDDRSWRGQSQGQYNGLVWSGPWRNGWHS